MIQLVDSPGTRASEADDKVALGFARQVDALVFMISALAPLDKEDKEYIAKHFANKRKKNVFFVVNKIDILNTDADIDVVKQYVREELTSVFLDENRIFDEDLYRKRVFYVNALGSMNTRLGRETTVGSSMKVMIPDEETGIPDFEASLQAFLTSENREKVALNAYLGQMADLYLVAERSVVERLEILAKLVSLLRKELYVKERESRLLEIDRELCNIDDMLMSNRGTLGLEKERTSCILHTFSKAISRMSELTGGVPLSAAQIKDMALRHRNS